MDAFVPDVGRFRHDQAVTTEQVGVGQVLLDAAHHDPVGQRIDTVHVLIAPAGIRLLPVAIRYAWPAEIDAMAMVAGLHLVERWADYDRTPFTARSTRHVSVYAQGDA